MQVIPFNNKTIFRRDWKKSIYGLLWIVGFAAAFATLFSYLNLGWAAEITIVAGVLFVPFCVAGSFGSLELSRQGILEKEFLSKREFKWSDVHSMNFVPGVNPVVEICLKREFSLEHPTVPNPYKLSGCYDQEPKAFIRELEKWWQSSLPA